LGKGGDGWKLELFTHAKGLKQKGIKKKTRGNRACKYGGGTGRLSGDPMGVVVGKKKGGVAQLGAEFSREKDPVRGGKEKYFTEPRVGKSLGGKGVRS